MAWTRLLPTRIVLLFRTETGTTVRHYLNRVRVEIARDLLRHTEEDLTEIAAFVGFFDASHLSRVFHQIVGQRPSACRRATSVKGPSSDSAQYRARTT